jgi:hypothetical protein
MSVERGGLYPGEGSVRLVGVAQVGCLIRKQNPALGNQYVNNQKRFL